MLEIESLSKAGDSEQERRRREAEAIYGSDEEMIGPEGMDWL